MCIAACSHSEVDTAIGRRGVKVLRQISGCRLTTEVPVMALLFVLINFVLGLLFSAVPSMVVIWRRGKLRRALSTLSLVLLPFGLGFMFMSMGWGPVKSIA